MDLSVYLSDSHELEEVSRSCVRLEWLCINMEEDEGLLENRTIVLPQTLENLIIEDARENVLKILFKVISAPNLKVLSIHSPKGRLSDKEIQLMDSFVSGSPAIFHLAFF